MQSLEFLRMEEKDEVEDRTIPCREKRTQSTITGFEDKKETKESRWSSKGSKAKKLILNSQEEAQPCRHLHFTQEAFVTLLTLELCCWNHHLIEH